MITRRGPILIVISLLLAVAAAWVANRWLIAQTASGDTGPSTVPVMTAAIEIPLGTKIEARHVSAIQMLRRVRPRGNVSERRGDRRKDRAGRNHERARYCWRRGLQTRAPEAHSLPSSVKTCARSACA